MEGFFAALSAFFESELAHSYGWVIIVSFVICLSISWVVMSFIFLKIIVPSKTVENIELKRSNEELTKKLKDYEKEKEDLECENQKLKEDILNFRFIESIEHGNPKPSESKALKKFLN